VGAHGRILDEGIGARQHPGLEHAVARALGLLGRLGLGVGHLAVG
jgi:hypothetical protein